MTFVVRFLFLLVVSGLLSAQSSPKAAGQQIPTKENPQGFSRDVLEPPSMKTDLGEQKTYTPPPADVPQPKVEVPVDLAKIVAAQFGPDCKIATERTNLVANYRIKPEAEAWTPFLTADLDGDGVEDAIIVARCKNALSRRDEFDYQMIDPYMAFHGYGDPKVTAEFTEGDPARGHVVLLIHGSGAEAWRAAKPKSKFVVLNLPFTNLGVTHVVPAKKKPVIAALLLQEGETMSSVVFWDGKKYRWRDSIGNQ